MFELNAADLLSEGVFSLVHLACRAALLKSLETAMLREETAARTFRLHMDKDRALANITHEPRTPLDAILGFSEILADPRLAPNHGVEQRGYDRVIHSSTDHLLSIVNLVFDMPRIEGSKFEILREPFDIGQLIASWHDMSRPGSRGAGVELVGPARGSLQLVPNKRACRQALLNLISNGVKFTPASGKVFVTAEIVGDACHLCVADTGIGIAEHHLPGLSDPLLSSSLILRSRVGGRRIGTFAGAPARRPHGGTLLIESVAGEGTRATVRFPVDCPWARTIGYGVPASGEGGPLQHNMRVRGYVRTKSVEKGAGIRGERNCLKLLRAFATIRSCLGPPSLLRPAGGSRAHWRGGLKPCQSAPYSAPLCAQRLLALASTRSSCRASVTLPRCSGEGLRQTRPACWL